MNKFARRRSIVVASIFAVIVTCLHGAGFASGEVRFRGVRGAFATFGLEGAWGKRAIVLMNRGEVPRRIKVVYLTDDLQRGLMRYTRTVKIPPWAQRWVPLACRTGRLDLLREPKSDRPDAALFCEETYEVWDAEMGKQLGRQGYTVVKLSPNLTILAIVNRQSEDYDTSSYIKEMPGRPLGKIGLLRASVMQDLPDRWYGYSMVDILALGAMDRSRLCPSQLDAILNWVRRGGTLVLTGGKHMEDMLAGPLGEVAGVSAVGMHFTDRLDITPRLPTPAPRLKLAVPIVELHCEEAEVLYEANGLPLLAHRRLGEGHVLTLATSLGALAPEELHGVWRRVAAVRRARPPLDGDAFVGPAKATLQSIAGRRGPKKATPLTILLALLVLTVVAGAVLRLKRRGELLWCALVPLGIVIAAVLHVYGQSRTTPQALSHIGLISGLGQERARVQQVFTYYSGPNERRLDFSAGSERGLITDLGAGAAGGIESGRMRTGAMLELPDKRVRPNSTSLFYIDAVEPAPGVMSKLTFDDKGLSGTLGNRFGATVENAVLYVNRRTYRLGDLAPNQDTLVSVDWQEPPGIVTFPSGEDIQRARKANRPQDTWAKGDFAGSLVTKDRRRNDLVRQLAARGANVGRGPVLIGYSPLSIVDPLPGRRLVRQGWSVVVWPLEIVAPEPGSEVAIPSGLVDLDFGHVGMTTWNRQMEQFITAMYPSELLLLARPPRPIGGLKNVSATIRVALDAVNYRLIVSGVKLGSDGRPASREQLDAFANPTGRIELQVPNADRFAHEDGRFVFSLKVEVLDKKLPPTERGSWKFESVDVALKGTVR